MATLKDVWEVIKQKLKLTYAGAGASGNSVSATIMPWHPFEVAYSAYKGIRGKDTKLSNVVSKRKFVAKRFCLAALSKLLNGPVLNIPCLALQRGLCFGR